MRIGNQDLFKKSSFKSIGDDFALIVKKILEDEDLKKLLYYNTENCLTQPNLTQQEAYSLIGKQIRIVPKLEFNDDNLSYIIISFDNFSPNAENPEFRDNLLMIDVICPFEQWDLGDFQLRPYKIAERLDVKLNNKHLTGIGTLDFLGMNNLHIDDKISGVTLIYSAVHGESDFNAKVE